ncbi:hypothetical protein TWF694_006908 [Orbilia ellipsospora]|uniref:Uncharacterized protein n=1 Tax=Orbilia ellipsospora TaxID=2528407 RepID=A0AAV9XN85_9PEZI
MEEGLILEEDLDLGLQAFTHEALEEEIAARAEVDLLEKEMKESEKAKEKEAKLAEKAEKQIKLFEGLVKNTFGPGKAKRVEQLEAAKAALALHKANIVDIDHRLQLRAARVTAAVKDSGSGEQRQGESRRDYLIRKGIINPFMADGPDGDAAGPASGDSIATTGDTLSFQELRAPGFAFEQPTKGTKKQKVTLPTADQRVSVVAPGISRKSPPPGSETLPSPSRGVPPTTDTKIVGFEDDYEDGEVRSFRPRRAAKRSAASEDDESDDQDGNYEGGEVDDDIDEEDLPTISKKVKGKAPAKKRRRTRDSDEEVEDEEDDLQDLDDGNEEVYQRRQKAWCAKRAAARVITEAEVKIKTEEDDDTPEWFKPSPSAPDCEVDTGFKLPGDIAQSLFDYQKTAVNWLWNLHAKQHTGGILGDEMGLGKTIQTIAFIAGLHYSQLLRNPVLVVAPATVLRQWCSEFHKWWPPLRVSILHSSGSGMSLKAANATGMIDDSDDILEVLERRVPSKAQKAAKKIIDKVKAKGHVLISTYEGLCAYQDQLLHMNWECVVLDEGHKIRNPDAKVTVAAKQLKSTTRFILSGTPIQNTLKELWSLFDFVYPGKLGIFSVFNEHIAMPIRLGSYQGASNLEKHAASKCAAVLHEMISPYLLRRLKKDVAVLPPKQDQVLFCNLVKQQHDAYKAYIHSMEADKIAEGKRDLLAGIDVLRKICNHPDLLNRVKLSNDPTYNYGNPLFSGKMQIVKSLLRSWQKDNLKCLIFCQGTQMLDILEKFVRNLEYSYLRLDGGTDIRSRQLMVDRFNSDPSLQVFLLTTKVGGYGLNLTGATRIIIFDPDWNPSNDTQARERSWRLGQKHEVRIYRLLCRGTIEEKIYQRQLYKQFLTKKVLEDPEQARIFRMDTMQDLFTLGDTDEATETGGMFEGFRKLLDQRKQIVEDEQSKEVEAMAGVDRLENFIGGGPNNTLADPVDEPEASASIEKLSIDTPTKTKGKDKKLEKSEKKDNVLEDILAKAGVHSIVQHDEISAFSKSSSAIIEREANKVAQSARTALQKSFEEVRKYSVPGQVVWTGRPTAQKKNKKTPLNNGKALKKTEIIPTIREWFQQQKGPITTPLIMNTFNPILTPKLTDYFTEQLKKQAEFIPGRKQWRLRSNLS